MRTRRGAKLSGTKTDSQKKSSSTGEPPGLETPQEVTDYTSDLPGLVAVPEQKILPSAGGKSPKPHGLEEAVTQQLESLSEQGVSMPRVRIIENGQETVGPLD